MKILLVITKAEIGGAQVFVLNLARCLSKLGHQVEVAAGSGDYLPNELAKLNIPFQHLKSLKRDVSIVGSFYFVFDIWRMLKKQEYDIVHLNSSNTLVSAFPAQLLKKRPKIVFTFHGLSLLDKNYEIHRIAKFFTKLYFKFFIKFVHSSIFVSRLNYDESKKEKLLDKGEVILNGLDEEILGFWDKDKARNYFAEKLNKDLSNAYLIGSTGRLAYQKNYEFLIDNFSKIKNVIPNVKVVIIGDGPNRKMFSEKIKSLGYQDDFLLVGAIKDSYHYIKAFDLFTLPSRYEGLSISLIEAIFAGIPILASDVGGNSEILGEGSEQLYILNDINDYLKEIITIKENSSHYCEVNKKIKEKFSLEKMVSSYEKVYLEIIEDKN